MKTIAYCGLRYNYARPEQGDSYEYNNLEAGFEDCAKRGMFRVRNYHPDVEGEMDKLRDELSEADAVFHVPFNEQYDLPEDLAKQALDQEKAVIAWDCDASWRFHNWIFPRRQRYSHFITTHPRTVEWYQRARMNVLFSQWAGSPKYLPTEEELSLPKDYDISFIGQKHGTREVMVNAFRDAGLDLHLFGNYWQGFPNNHGYLTNFEDMRRVFLKSKICLNFSNPFQIGTMPQIKGRHFEIPQTHGFQLATMADGLQHYFTFQREIVVVPPDDAQSFVASAKYFLDHEDEREGIARAGHERMLKEHQWYHRFEHIFGEIGI